MASALLLPPFFPASLHALKSDLILCGVGTVSSYVAYDKSHCRHNWCVGCLDLDTCEIFEPVKD